MTHPVIDFHAHVVDPDVYATTVNHNIVSGFGAHPMTLPTEGTPRWGVFSRMVDPGFHVQDMDARGVDVHVISTSLVSQSTWWAEPRLAAELDRRANVTIAKWVATYPDRFVGSFTLPLQNIPLAMKELDFAVTELGLKIANVSSNAHGAYIGEPRFRPFWQAAQELRLPVLIHPHGIADVRFQKFALWNGVGQPIEETLAMASIIYEGVLDAFPDLKIIIVHGGGYFPHYTGRLDRNATYHPASVENMSRLPSDYLSSFYYDTCVYDPLVLESLVRRVGPRRLVLGGDYPFGPPDPVGPLRESSVLNESDVTDICTRTPARLLGLG